MKECGYRHAGGRDGLGITPFSSIMFFSLIEWLDWDMENIFSVYKNDDFDVNRISLDNGLQQGEYFIGPTINFCSHPVKDITECIAKQQDSDEYVIFKILHCVHDEKRGHNSQGRVLFHNEHLILSLLQDTEGVIHHHGLFKFCDKFILVLDCMVCHEHDKQGAYRDFVNLQQYVIQKKQLQGTESLEIFCSIMTTLKTLHQVKSSLPIIYIQACSTKLCGLITNIFNHIVCSIKYFRQGSPSVIAKLNFSTQLAEDLYLLVDL